MMEHISIDSWEQWTIVLQKQINISRYISENDRVRSTAYTFTVSLHGVITVVRIETNNFSKYFLQPSSWPPDIETFHSTSSHQETSHLAR